MDPADSRSLLLGLLVGVVVGAALSGPLAVDALSPSTGTETPATSVAKAGPSCYDGPRDHDGWLHVVANGETWGATLNATVLHPPGTEIDVDVSERPIGGYEIALETVDATRERSLSDVDCEVATRLDVATSLEEPKLAVTVDGRTIRTVDQDETVANLYPLPNSIDATE